MPPTNANDPLRTTDHDPRAAPPRLGVGADFASGSTPVDGNTAAHVLGRGTVPERDPASVSVPGYEIECVLGRGGMGVVYKARHLTLKRTVALKMIMAGGHAGPQELARFRIEAEAVARLQHPNIVQIHEVGEADGHPYCALEFVEGGNLASKLNGKPMAAREAAKLVEALARAMQLAHSRNVVHRDLKPANIFLTAEGTPKITDFGLARRMDSDSGETQAGAVMGTPSYMAPEQASGHAHEAGPAADVYALGAILYDCLTGRPPFKGSTVVETLDQVRTQEPTAPSRRQADVPLDLETICLKCLRKEPEKRYASAAELADELVRYQQGAPILARPVGLLERTWKWAKRHPGRAVASVAGVLILVVALVAANEVRTQREADRIAADEKRAADLRITRAESHVDALTTTETQAVGRLLADLEEYRDLTGPSLRALAGQPIGTRPGLHARLALLADEPDRAAELAAYLPACRPEELLTIRQLLTPHAAAVAPPLWAMLSYSKADAGKRLRAGAALAKFDPESQRWSTASAIVVNDLVLENPIFLGMWSEAFRPVRIRLLPRLREIFRDHQPGLAAERSLATSILGDYAADQPHLLAELLMDADDKQFAAIFPKFKQHSERGAPVLTGEIDKQLPPELPSADDSRETLAKRQANAAVALLRMNQPTKVWPLLKHSTDPRVRSYLIHRLSPLGADAAAIIKRLDEEPDITIRRALLLSLGEYGETNLPADIRDGLLPKFQEMYRTSSDPGLHAAAEWLLRTWKQEEWLTQMSEEWAKDNEQRQRQLESIKQTLAKDKEKTQPQWYVNGQGQTMVVIPGPVTFLMGSPKSEKDREDNEAQHKRRIGRTFAIAAKSVTLAEYRRMTKDKYEIGAKYTRYADLPVVAIDWYMAARYCNLLSKEEGIDEDQWCYETNANGKVTKLKAGYLSLSGYRLPTEAEMEYATRAGSLTSRYYGESEELLGSYAWYTKNSGDLPQQVGTKKPNDFGLFDAQGNCFTWCQELYEAYPGVERDQAVEDKEAKKLMVIGTDIRVMRGGAFISQPLVVRSSFRNYNVPSNRFNYGFRVARTLPLGASTAFPATP